MNGMKTRKKYLLTIGSHIDNIPCLICVTKFDYVTRFGGGRKKTDEPVDIEYEVLNRKDYRAEWLEEKIDDETDRRIQQEIKSEYQDYRD